MTISLTTGDGRMLLHVASFPSIEAAKRAAIEFARGRLQAEHQKELAKLCKAG